MSSQNTGNDSALDLDEDGFIETMKANVIGPARVAKAYIPLLEKGERKVLMNMSSGLGSIGRDLGPKAASYSISKTALNMLVSPSSTISYLFTDLTQHPADLQNPKG